MLTKILSKIENVSMTTGRFFSDKSYKYDTILFVTRYLLDLAKGDLITINNEMMDNLIKQIANDFQLNDQSYDANKNYILETEGFLVYGKVLEKIDSHNYKIIDRELIEFIASSIENAYIFQYLVAYKTFVNDGVWPLYVDYVNEYDSDSKSNKLFKIKGEIVKLSQSIQNEESVWASNMTKFPLMVLGLANGEHKLSRTLNIQDDILVPHDLAANISGTRSPSEKNNFYLKDFRLNYVRAFLEPVLANSTYNANALEGNVIGSGFVPNRIKGGKNTILYGVPGAGKSFTIQKEYCNDESMMERVVFHPDYTYADFVGQILPAVDANGEVSYKFTPGPFTKLLKTAVQNPTKHYYLIIEEINRGNAPAIFGDIFQLLDRDKIGNSCYAITNSDIANIVYNDANQKVRIPSNMSILATMNTSDQNVFTLDTAFQRRWNMRLVKNKFHENEDDETKFATTNILDTHVNWETFFTEINKIILDKNIKMTSSEDKRLGTHFVNEEDLVFNPETDSNGLMTLQARLDNSRFPEKVLKYLWDDAFKFTKEDIFDTDKYKSLEDVIEKFISSKGDERFRVFKDNIYSSLIPTNNN